MKANFSKLLIASAIAAAFAVPATSVAEQTQVTGAGTITTNARHDFRVIIPRFLQFRVGATAGTISLVECDLTPAVATLGDGTDFVGCTGGDAGGGVSNVVVRSNAGQITLTATTLGALSNGVDTLPFSEILTATSTGTVPAPVLPAAGGTSAGVPVTLSAGALTNRTATWTYTYDNTAVYASGTYGGVGVNNGRVTYTASSP